MIRQDANKVDNELRFISLKVERAHTGRLYKGPRVIRTLSAGALHFLGLLPICPQIVNGKITGGERITAFDF
jgi:hypothetical protein